MASIELRAVTKRFGRVVAVDALSLSVAQGEVVCLLGAPGAGKTTTLRLIAGLERPDSGTILFDGRPVEHVAPQDRDVGMVFEDLALYPHLSGFDNIAHPLRLRRLATDEIRRRVDAVARLLDIGHLLDRLPHTFSGGERQRVAFARAVVRQPAVLLLDEPLSNLDAKVREAMRAEIVRLQETLQQTTLMATHDYEEAMAIGARVAVLHRGRLLQVGSPEDIYERPASATVAQLTGSPPMNLLPCTVEDGMLRADGLALPVSGASGRVLLGVRPEAIALGGPLDARVEVVQPLGRKVIVEVALGERTRIKVTLPPGRPIRRGETVRIGFDPGAVRLFDAATGAAIAGARVGPLTAR